MTRVLAFDVYGTLIDTAGVVTELGRVVGDKAVAFSALWRDKQLEYSFRRGLMRCYQDFSVCVAEALDFTATSLGCDLKPEQRQSLLAAYRHLPAFPDAAAAVADLGEAGYALYAFSNGSAQTVGGLLEGAGILQCFRDVISVEAVRSFKPDPAVYRHFLQRAGVTADRAALVSGNAFDVIGAMNAGLAGFWVRRSNSVRFDPWGIEPDLTVGSLAELKARLAESSA